MNSVDHGILQFFFFFEEENDLKSALENLPCMIDQYSLILVKGEKGVLPPLATFETIEG